MVVKWTFYDAVEDTTYTFAINPNDGGSPDFQKNINYQATTAPSGKTVISEGLDKVQELTWSGTILDQAQYNAYITWWQKRRQIKVTDDLGREFWVYLVSFTPKRVRARSHPWKHTYDVTASILDWTAVV